MAETKPMTTGTLLGDDKKDDVKKPNEAGATAAKSSETAPVPGAKASQAARKPAATQVDNPSSAAEAETKPGDPSPTQAELDAMREATLRGGQRRDVKAEAESVDYKTR